jgi:hypothetical protein
MVMLTRAVTTLATIALPLMMAATISSARIRTGEFTQTDDLQVTVEDVYSSGVPRGYTSIVRGDLLSLWTNSSYISGKYSEKAAVNGQPGIGHPRFATQAAGDDIAVIVIGYRGRQLAAPTRAAILVSDGIMKVTGGVWPGVPTDLRALLRRMPSLIVAEVIAERNGVVRISGVTKGKNLVILLGSEYLWSDTRPPNSQGMVVRVSQISADIQGQVLPSTVSVEVD